MGFFSSRTRGKSGPRFSDPPNVYFTPAPHPPLPLPLPLPPRLATAPGPPALAHGPVPPPPGVHLAPPPGWTTPAPGPAPIPPAAGRTYHHFAGQHPPPPPPQRPHPPGGTGVWAGSAPGPTPAPGIGPAADEIGRRLARVLTLIDSEQCAGHEPDLFLCRAASPPPPPPFAAPPPTAEQPFARDGSADAAAADRAPGVSRRRPAPHDAHPPQTSSAAAAAALSGWYFSKVELYVNSKLPIALPPLSLHPSAWPLVCLAAQSSLRVYSPAAGPARRRSLDVPADRRSGSKAMYIKTVADDAARTVVLAVRGSASFADWAVNLRAGPAPPTGFLDDAGNACHAGFLAAARAMVRPAARRLRRLLRDDPARGAHCLVLTGHSAGGAVAALLYMHLLAAGPAAASELNALAARFRRLHCITFGAPPVSLLALAKPSRPELRSSLFLAFVNEGDPVARADKSYVKSLLALLASPNPAPGPAPPFWALPPSTLSNAGRIVLLRPDRPHAPPPADAAASVQHLLVGGVEAVTCRDDQLRGVVWGDPVCHLMSLYAARIETLAAVAVAAANP